MNSIELLFAIVYRLTVTYSKAQFDKPISREAQIPIGASHLKKDGTGIKSTKKNWCGHTSAAPSFEIVSFSCERLHIGSV